MEHLPKLIEDLALILITGAVTTLVFRWIKQPLVLGYIIAGFLVGPHLSITPTVADTGNIETLAEIGVIFLLFSLGLEFSFKKLMRVGGAASITAFVEIVFITVSGYVVGQWMGWSTMDSVFLGGMLASSSTTIIIRAFDELGVKSRQFARVVFGVLVVEDIVVIVLMVLLSTMSISQQFEGMELLKTVGKLLFFLVLWFLTGIFLLPTFLKRAAKLMDEETLLIMSIGLCLGMVILATQVGFSAELGAFIMGSIMAETTSAEKIEHVIKPVKDLFGAVFFVSVGMLIDPAAIMEHKWAVLWVTLLTIGGKFFSTTIGALISGQPLKQSVQVGMSMAQIGEFAFIVATLGLSLGVISPFLFPVAVGASAITTFTTPYMIKASDSLYKGISAILPSRWLTIMNRYAAGTQNLRAETSWQTTFKAYGLIMISNGIMILALFFLSMNVLFPFVAGQIENGTVAALVTLAVSLTVAAPFLMAFMLRRPKSMSYRELWLDKKYNRGPLLMVEILRIFLGIVIIGAWVNRLLSTTAAMLVALPTIIIVYWFFSRRIQQFYQRIEGRFLGNLNERENQPQNDGSISPELFERNVALQSDLAPWSAHIVDMEVKPEASFIGKTLEELAWREQYGINIGYIKRGEKLIAAPSRWEKLFPFDHVGIIATDEQIQLFKPAFESVETGENGEAVHVSDIELHKLVVDEFTRLKGLSIRQSGIREETNGLVIGIERGNYRMFNPDSSTVFEWGDVVWMVGDRNKILSLAKRGA